MKWKAENSYYMRAKNYFWQEAEKYQTKDTREKIRTRHKAENNIWRKAENSHHTSVRKIILDKRQKNLIRRKAENLYQTQDRKSSYKGRNILSKAESPNCPTNANWPFGKQIFVEILWRAFGYRLVSCDVCRPFCHHLEPKHHSVTNWEPNFHSWLQKPFWHHFKPIQRATV